MRNLVLICAIFLGHSVSPLRAGSVVTKADGSETTGKLTLNPTAIHLEGLSTSEINLPDVLEAKFGEVPFQLDFFSSNSTPDKLPANWKAQAIGNLDMPGSFTYANGTFTLNGSAGNLESREDTVYFVSQPWTGDGEWTARLKQTDGENQTEGGLLVRESIDPKSPMCSLGMTNLNPSEGWSCFRGTPGESSDIRGASINLPTWFRISRRGASFDISVSGDGKDWGGVYTGFGKLAENTWVGLYLNSRRPKTLGQGVFDQVTFTPPPSEAQTLPPGVLLRSGSFLAGFFNPLDFDAAKPDATGNFNRNGNNVAIPRSQVSAVTLSSTARSELASLGSQVGFIMRNGDFMAGEPEAINGGGVRVSSLILGVISYDRSQVRACVLLPPQPQSADYEIRLRDGSIIRATSLGVNNGQLVIGEVSGIAVTIDPGEIAQFRAGSSQVQSLTELKWKATPPPAAPATNVPPATNAAPTPNAAPIANAVVEQLPPVQCWGGKNQEQIIEASVGTSLEFPLSDKFRALAVRVALSPDSPPNSNVIIRVLANGREIARTPPFKAGDQPRFMQVTLQQDPKTVTIEADSAFTGARVLFIDPIAIRENVTPTP